MGAKVTRTKQPRPYVGTLEIMEVTKNCSTSRTLTTARTIQGTLQLQENHLAFTACKQPRHPPIDRKHHHHQTKDEETTCFQWHLADIKMFGLSTSDQVTFKIGRGQQDLAKSSTGVAGTFNFVTPKAKSFYFALDSAISSTTVPATEPRADVEDHVVARPRYSTLLIAARLKRESEGSTHSAASSSSRASTSSSPVQYATGQDLFHDLVNSEPLEFPSHTFAASAPESPSSTKSLSAFPIASSPATPALRTSPRVQRSHAVTEV
eukprot:m.352862 g.352862  ORF g.352862 m.352862 type:complete len:265 (-) comp16626_c0_seq1:310-1104(-)